MNIKILSLAELEILKKYDSHVSAEVLKSKLKDGSIIGVYEGDEFIGWIRFNYFWDEYPFMNLLYIIDKYRGQGYGTALTNFWEIMMFKQGHKLCMVSTMANETSQNFYRSRGYKDIGGFVLEGEPLEIIMTKVLEASDNNVT